MAISTGSTKPLKWLATSSTGRPSGSASSPATSTRRNSSAAAKRATHADEPSHRVQSAPAYAGRARGDAGRTWSASATKLPAVEESTSYGTPALKVGGKVFVRLRSEAEGGLVLFCDLTEKEALLQSGDPAFFTTPHYDGYGAILVDLAAVDRALLAEMIEESWYQKAPAKLVKARDAGRA